MGSPGVAWSVKSPMQKIGYMAAVVHPKVQMLFASPEGGENEGYTCEDCHGSNAELNDYKMPTDDLYALPRENPVQDALEYDADVTAFMQNTLTPEFDQLLNRGVGPKTAVNCFTCHPVDE